MMQSWFYLLGRWLFPRQQEWEQRKSAKTLVLTLGFALTLGIIVAETLRLMYDHKK